jgi:hypothetical protein
MLARNASPADFKLLEVDPNHAAGIWRNLLVVYWLGDTRPGAVARLTQPMLRLGAQFEDGIGLMQVVGPKTAAPTSEARAALATLLKAGREVIVCSSLVVPGVGFRMAAARGLATGLIMLARPPFPHEVYATVEQAAEWQCTRLPRHKSGPPRPDQVLSVVDALRCKLPEAPESGVR